MTEFARQEDSFRQTRRAFVEAVPVAVATLVRCANAVYGPARLFPLEREQQFAASVSAATFRP